MKYLGFDDVNYFIQTANIPTMTMPEIELPYQVTIPKFITNTPNFGPLGLTFLMDEEFYVYKTIQGWMLSFIDDAPWNDLVKDIILYVLSANKTPLLTFTFKNAFPVEVGDMTFQSDVSEVTPLVFNASFRYQYFAVS